MFAGARTFEKLRAVIHCSPHSTVATCFSADTAKLEPQESPICRQGAYEVARFQLRIRAWPMIGTDVRGYQPRSQKNSPVLLSAHIVSG